MTETKDNRVETKKQWQMVIQALNFFIPFYSLKIMLENYLMEDRLPLTYFFIIALISAAIAGALSFLVKERGLKIKAFATAMLLMIMIVLNFLIN